MSYRLWLNWFNKIDIDLKWFVLLILFRPIIDTTSHITIFFFSPLEIMGVLIVILIIFFIINKKQSFSDRYVSPRIDKQIKLFSLLLLINLSILCILHPSFVNLGNSLKFIIPFFLFFYLKNRVNTDNDLHGILQTVLYSSIFPFSMLLYETLFGAINPQLYRDQVMHRGLYADLFNYSITWFMAFSIVVYFYLINIGKSNLFGYLLCVLFCLGLLVLYKIDHSLSNVTFGVIMIYSLLAILRYKNNVLIRIGLFVGGFFIILIFYQTIMQGFNQTFETEIAILSGDVVVERALHGRMYRWFNYFSIWDDLGFLFHFFGTPLSGHPRSGTMISGGMHSDYVRILFGTGFVGLAFYLSFLVRTFFLKANGEFALSVLRRNLLIIVVLFSVTSMPINYQTMMYVFMTVIAYGQRRFFWVFSGWTPNVRYSFHLHEASRGNPLVRRTILTHKR